ncbi:hypothetical protein TRFO_12246 [Tritrichomonas foetus]|uniref:Uncharacterized protein n=1 Tax=Tritrichomonas foetus TaxID=1144522 RepID=A0A1J4J0B9_9EUKA|nr:hypothetical protein TRFO_12246 [Tritrichomonas foetus]|eukprot:OHS92874.1 hypothetical protein TRFO_12246 [Tritrichomonas foetus]
MLVIYLLQIAASSSFCFYSSDSSLCPSSSELIDLTQFSQFKAKDLSSETEIELYVADDFSENCVLDFTSLKASKANIKIQAVGNNHKNIYLSIGKSFFKSHKSLKLERISIHPVNGGDLEFPDLTLVDSKFIQQNEINVMANEIHSDISSLSQIHQLSALNFHIIMNNFVKGSSSISGVFSTSPVSIEDFSDGKYRFVFAEDQIFIYFENNIDPFILTTTEFTQCLSIVSSNPKAEISLLSIVESLTSTKQKIEIMASNGAVFIFSDCKWPSINTEIVFNHPGDANIELFSADIPLKINAGEGNLNINLNSGKASILSLTISDNEKENVIINNKNVATNQEYSFYPSNLLISKLFASSQSLNSEGDNLTIIVSSLYPTSDTIRLNGDAYYSFISNITTSIVSIEVDNFIWSGSFNFHILFSLDDYSTLKVNKNLIFEKVDTESKNFVIVSPISELKNDDLSKLVGKSYDIITAPPQYNLSRNQFRISFEKQGLPSSANVNMNLLYSNVFTTQVTFDKLILSISRNINDLTNQFCIGQNEKCPSNFMTIENMDGFQAKIYNISKSVTFYIFKDSLIDLSAYPEIYTLEIIAPGNKFEVTLSHSLLSKPYFKAENVKIVLNDGEIFTGEIGLYSYLINIEFDFTNVSETNRKLKGMMVSCDINTIQRVPLTAQTIFLVDLIDPTINLYQNGISINKSEIYEIFRESSQPNIIFTFSSHQYVKINCAFAYNDVVKYGVQITSEVACDFDVNGTFPSSFKGIFFTTLRGLLEVHSEHPPVYIDSAVDGSFIISNTEKVYFNGTTDLRADITFNCAKIGQCQYIFEEASINAQNSLKFSEESNGILKIDRIHFFDTKSSIQIPRLLVGKEFIFDQPARVTFNSLEFESDSILNIPFSMNDRTFIQINNFTGFPPKVTSIDFSSDFNDNELESYLKSHYIDVICAKGEIQCDNWNFEDKNSKLNQKSFEVRCYSKSSNQQCIAITSKDAPIYQTPSPSASFLPSPTAVPTPTREAPTASPIQTEESEEDKVNKLSALMISLAVFLTMVAVVSVIVFVRWMTRRYRMNRPDIIETTNPGEALALETENIEPAKIDKSLEENLL